MKRDLTRSTTKSDYSRATFRPEKHYSSVRMQQGRVQLDADWNEQIDIAAYRTEVESFDVIGACGGPLGAAGFALTDGPAPQITSGRYYVDGILIENEANLPLGQQPDLPGVGLPTAPTSGDDLYIAYLDVWQRHISALEDNLLREVALNGPDTTTRTQSLWQVRLLGPLAAPLNCASEPLAWQNLFAAKSGQLSARAPEGQTDPDPCAIPPGAGYRRLENQLYRIEIHNAGAPGTATFKWSRENGSIVTTWLDKKNDDLIVGSVGKDKVLGFAAGQTIEVIDDQRELRGEAGILAELARAEGQALTLAPGSPAINKADFPDTLAGQPNHPKIRRWDSDGLITVPSNTNMWVELEDGVQIKFEPGLYNVGDYWLVPARTVSGDVEWPFITPQPPAGITHHFCKLAIATRNAAGFTFTDCRNLFPPLTHLTTLLYESGDGQEANANQPLPHACRVRVVNGQAPVTGAQVLFTIESGGGSLSVDATATVAPDGIAETTWTLGANGPQRLRVDLLDAAGQPIPGQLLHYNATMRTAGRGCCITVGDGGEFARLDEAILTLLNQGQRDLCFCLMPGDHALSAFTVEMKFGDLPPCHLQVKGCGLGSRITADGPITLSGFAMVTLDNFALDFRPEALDDQHGLSLVDCAHVTVTACHLAALPRNSVLLHIAGANQIRLANNIFEAARIDSLEVYAELFGQAEASLLSKLYKVLFGRDFQRFVIDVAAELAALSSDERKQLAEKIQNLFPNLALTEAEMLHLARFLLVLRLETSDAQTLATILLDLRRAGIKARPGVALVLTRSILFEPPLDAEVIAMDIDDLTLVENNVFVGEIGLFGMPAAPDLVEQVLNVDIMQLLESRLKELRRLLTRGFLGTLQMRGNHLLRIALDEKSLSLLPELVRGETEPWFVFWMGVYSRIHFTDNVVDGMQNAILGERTTLNTNEFLASASTDTTIGFVVTANGIYIGNRGRNVDHVLFDVSGQPPQLIANVEMTIA